MGVEFHHIDGRTKHLWNMTRWTANTIFLFHFPFDLNWMFDKSRQWKRTSPMHLFNWYHLEVKEEKKSFLWFYCLHLNQLELIYCHRCDYGRKIDVVDDNAFHFSTPNSMIERKKKKIRIYLKCLDRVFNKVGNFEPSHTHTHSKREVCNWNPRIGWYFKVVFS